MHHPYMCTPFNLRVLRWPEALQVRPLVYQHAEAIQLFSWLKVLLEDKFACKGLWDRIVA